MDGGLVVKFIVFYLNYKPLIKFFGALFVRFVKLVIQVSQFLSIIDSIYLLKKLYHMSHSIYTVILFNVIWYLKDCLCPLISFKRLDVYDVQELERSLSWRNIAT